VLSEPAHVLPLAKPVEGVSGKTGTWRVLRPVFNNSKCVKCRLCWLYCPESVIDIVDREDAFITINYEYCKGCGICSDVCPVNAIELVPEGGE
jgi:pyruvate ferredoxin oxidoreductase delta subunit